MLLADRIAQLERDERDAEMQLDQRPSDLTLRSLEYVRAALRDARARQAVRDRAHAARDAAVAATKRRPQPFASLRPSTPLIGYLALPLPPGHDDWLRAADEARR